MDESLKFSLVDAVFESASGWTTTGATVISNIDNLNKPLLLYRQLLQWLGGIGIVVLVLAILPILELEACTCIRLRPHLQLRIISFHLESQKQQRACGAYTLYLTIACAVLYKIAGMSYFDAIGHSFSTVSIGDFLHMMQVLDFIQVI